MKQIIFKYLKELGIEGLASFKNAPAIFLDQAPDDSDTRWDGSQYGRIIYGLNLKDDSERKVSGTMEIAIAYLFNNKGYKNLLEAKKILKKAFEGVFLTDADTSDTTRPTRTLRLLRSIEISPSLVYYFASD